MKKVVACIVFCLVLGGMSFAFAEEKPRVGVLRFTNDTNAGWWSYSVGRDLQDMLSSELVSTKAFQVLE